MKSFAGEFVVKRGKRDAERLNGAHGIRVIHREVVGGRAPELHHNVVHCK